MMGDVEMWNNPSCSKCAAAREALDGAGAAYSTRQYLDEPPTVEELTEVLRRLGSGPWDICRVDEPAGAALGIAEWPRDDASAARWIAAMVEHPELIQRPILLLDDGSAVVGRTPQALSDVLGRLAPP